MTTKYFISSVIDNYTEQREVDLAGFIRAERMAGFRPKGGGDGLATGGFCGNNLRGRMVEVPTNGVEAIATKGEHDSPAASLGWRSIDSAPTDDSRFLVGAWFEGKFLSALSHNENPRGPHATRGWQHRNGPLPVRATHWAPQPPAPPQPSPVVGETEEPSQWGVEIRSYDRWSPHENGVISWHGFDTFEKAQAFTVDYNSRNTARTTPEYYTQAKAPVRNKP